MGAGRLPRYWHVAPGHEPGPQSRRRLFNRQVLAPSATFVVVVVMAVAIAGGSHPTTDRYGRATTPLPTGLFLLIGLGVAVLFAGIIWSALNMKAALSLRQRARPPRLGGVHIGLDRTDLVAGQSLHISLTLDDDHAEGVEAALVAVAYAERVGGYHQAASTDAREVHRHELGSPIIPGTQSYDVVIPADAPFSYEGNFFTVAWFVVVQHGRRRAVAPVWVQPHAGPTYSPANGHRTSLAGPFGGKCVLDPVTPGSDHPATGSLWPDGNSDDLTVTVQLVEHTQPGPRSISRGFTFELIAPDATVSRGDGHQVPYTFSYAFSNGVPALMDFNGDGIRLQVTIKHRRTSTANFPVQQ